jgi:hypothetical protein
MFWVVSDGSPVLLVAVTTAVRQGAAHRNEDLGAEFR